ncbi:MAG: hypothetical protein DI570_08455 [Phenylobacterium zucineum]|nr:MAG: hypothetical protein DI570_08455 [Phenylobacterium zucineum]
MTFLPPGVEVAAHMAFVEVVGDKVAARGRWHPLRVADGQPTTAVAHVQIDRRRPLAWTGRTTELVSQAVLNAAAPPWVRTLQLDFEVRASEREHLLAVVKAVKAGLRPGVRFSMTALASWCETESWLADAPVDEVTPMLFRMGPGGARIRARLAAGGDFAGAHCRTSLAIATDTPLAGAPAGRRVYLFNPRSWTRADFEAARARVQAW